MSRTAHRLFSLSLRSSARNAAASSPRAALFRRMMSSESHASTSNDRPWMIGSALVFGPLFLYLVSPSARPGSHGHSDHARKSHHDEHADKHAQHVEPEREMDVKPIADDEGTAISGQEVKESMEKAFEADSPKDAREREEVVAKTETTGENSAIEAHTSIESGSSTDATPAQSQPDSTPATSAKLPSATSDGNAASA